MPVIPNELDIKEEHESGEREREREECIGRGKRRPNDEDGKGEERRR